MALRKIIVSFLYASFVLLPNLVFAQRTDTVSTVAYGDKSSWRYRMENSKEGWGLIKNGNHCELFVKTNRLNYNPINRVTANVSFYGKGTLYWLNGYEEIELAAAGITPQNKDSFFYHVTLNDSTELVTWSNPKIFGSVNGLTYACLGKFQTNHRIIRLEIYKLGKYHDRQIITFNGLYFPPAKLQHMVLHYTNQYLFKPHMQHYIPDDKHVYFQKEQWNKNSIRFPWAEDINHLAVQMEPTIQNDLYNVYLKRTIKGKTDTAYVSNAWEQSYYGNAPLLRINSSFFNKPGRYEVLVVPELPDDFRRNTMDSAVSVAFTVLPSDTISFSFQQVLLGLGLLLLICCLIFFIIKRRTASKLAYAAQQRETAKLQLTSVRAQLNPHFMFNALAGIQNLINKNDLTAANLYLTRFARITRNVLEEHKDDRISISEESKLLHDYLQMEQMRFGFSYQIEVDEALDEANTELPAMLLQPFVENAVKHGVASLREGGLIEMTLRKENQNIVVMVQDNGSGFDTAAHQNGKGLELSRKRIELLNRLNQEAPIHLSISSGKDGTIVSITLQNWL